MQLTRFDKALLNLVQTGLPLEAAPFAAIAERLGCSEQEVLERLEVLRAQGMIRRLGAFFDAETLGYKGVLVAAKVAPEYLQAVAAAINAMPQVTHNDERDHEYSLWFTVQDRDEAAMESLLQTVAKMPGVIEVLPMKTTGRYKVNLEFQLK